MADSMARQGLNGRPKRKGRNLTRPDKAAEPVPDLVKRDFTAQEINEKWCGDLTEIPTDEGKLYLAAVEDLASRRVPGFSISEHHDAEVAAAAIQMAAATRGGDVRGVIFHSDKGSEYTARTLPMRVSDSGSPSRWGESDRLSTMLRPKASTRLWSSNCSRDSASAPRPKPAVPWPRSSTATTASAGTTPAR